MYECPHLEQVKLMIGASGKFIQVILGPRQVGKTPMVINSGRTASRIELACG